jgi:thiol-disulfide isomerase/thioredoxin
MESNKESAIRHWVDDRLATLTAPVDWEPDTGAGIVRFRRGREARSRTTRMCLWIGAAAATIVPVLLAFPGPRVFAQRCVDACLAETAIAPSFLHRHATAAQTGRQSAPDFTLPDASGITVRLSSLRGQVVLLNFWATWCAPCQVEILFSPDMPANHLDSHAGPDVEIFIIRCRPQAGEELTSVSYLPCPVGTLSPTKRKTASDLSPDRGTNPMRLAQVGLG